MVYASIAVGDATGHWAGHFFLRAPSRRVWWVDFGVMEWGVIHQPKPYKDVTKDSVLI